MKRRMVAVGECMAEFRRGPEDAYALGYAGDCFNTAYYFNMIAGDRWATQFYTAVGTDDISDRMVAFMAKGGIDVSQVRRLQGLTVGLYLIDLKNGERLFQYWRSASAARRMIEDAPLKKALHEADLVYVSGITLAILDEPSRIALMEAMNDVLRAGKAIAFDPNLRRTLWQNSDTMKYWAREAASRASFVLPSFDDENAAFGDRSSRETAERYRSYGTSHIIVKNGPKPILALVNGTAREIPVIAARAVVDTTSAGDAFNGAYLAHLLAGKSVREAAEDASRLAAKVVGEHGAIVPRERILIDKKVPLT